MKKEHGLDMALDRVAGLVRGAALRLSKIRSLAMGALLVAMLYMVAHIAMRYLFNAPLRGVTDAQGLLMTVLIAATLADRALHGGHLALELLFNNLPPRPRAIWGTIISLVSFGFVVLMVWASGRYIWIAFDYQMATQVLKFPDFIPVAILTLGLAALAMAFFSDLLGYLAKAIKR